MTTNRTYARHFGQTLTVFASLLLGLSAAHAAETVTYYHTDALGTPVMESNAFGTVIYIREHKPYGEQALGVAKNGPGFTGHLEDADTGLSYMQARYFDPVASRFLSIDPIPVDIDSGSNYNRYWYANNNPYRFTDPDGRRARAADPCGWCDTFTAGDGGGGGREDSSADDNAESKGQTQYQSFKDLPKLPDGNSSPDGQTYSGEGWERVERFTGQQGVIWNAISESQWAELPTSLLTNIFRKTPVGRVVVPDIQYAKQTGFWGTEYQVGYQHVFSHKENGIFQPNREIFTGHGTIWTSERVWRKDRSYTFSRYRFREKL